MVLVVLVVLPTIVVLVVLTVVLELVVVVLCVFLMMLVSRSPHELKSIIGMQIDSIMPETDKSVPVRLLIMVTDCRRNFTV